MRILAIGDSTTFGQYVEDFEAWPAQLQTVLDKEARNIEVINAGLIGASSFQGLCYLMKRGFELKPDMVIATYGFNDRATWNAADRKGVSPLGQGLLDSVVGTLVQEWEAGRNTAPASAPRTSAGEYLDTLTTMASLCEARGIILYLIVWPNPTQITEPWDAPLDPKTYQSLIFEAGKRSSAKIIDLRQPFHDAPQPVLVDNVHASPAGCRIVAECVARQLKADLGVGP
jgi:lysophospholipase L1-like esterase